MFPKELGKGSVTERINEERPQQGYSSGAKDIRGS